MSLFDIAFVCFKELEGGAIGPIEYSESEAHLCLSQAIETKLANVGESRNSSTADSEVQYTLTHFMPKQLRDPRQKGTKF